MKSLWLSKKAWMPMVIVSLLLCIMLPTAISYVGTYTSNFSMGEANDVQKVVDAISDKLPDGEFKEKITEFKELGKQFTLFFLSYMMVSVFLMVTVINSMVTSTSSFVGEKERGTLETLLFSPITVKELFLGKVLASFIPSIVLTYGAYIICLIIVNIITYPIFQTILMVNSMWIILMFWLIPALVLFNILLNVLISAKMKTFQEAQQLGGLLVLPFVGLIVSQMTGLFLISPTILFVFGIVLFVLNILLLFIVTKTNQRNSLFENQIH